MSGWIFGGRFVTKLMKVIIMIIVGEVAWLGSDLVRSWTEINVASGIKTQQRSAAVDRASQDGEDEVIYIGAPAVLRAAAKYWPVDKGLRASAANGNGYSNQSWLDWLKDRDGNVFAPASLSVLPAGAEMTPFFNHVAAGIDHAVGVEVPFTSHPAYSRVATVKVPELGAVECVIATIGNQIIFIPLADYKAAGLPMR